MQEKISYQGEYIPKKDAAMEVYLSHKKVLILSIGGIATTFVLLAVPRPAVYIVAILPCVAAIMYFMKSVKRMNDLNEKYSLGFKKIEVKK